jgi:spindle assembly abnormal protein 6
MNMDSKMCFSGNAMNSNRIDDKDRRNMSSLSIKSENMGGEYNQYNNLGLYPNNAKTFEDPIYKHYKNNMFNSVNSKAGKDVGKKAENETNVMEMTIPVKYNTILNYFRVKSDEKDDWIRELKITMIVNFISPSKQIISINLTDASDPLFLYRDEISEQEFHTLKNDQSLIIEFQHFPQIFFEMLEMCNSNKTLLNDRDSNILNKSTFHYNYICVLHHRNINDALLIIQERTQFKEVNHLILTLKPANDSILKKYLASQTKEFKFKSETLYKDNLKLNENLEVAIRDVKILQEQLSSIKSTQFSEIEGLKLDHQKEMTELKEKIFEESRIKLEQKEYEKQTAITDLNFKIDELNKKVDDYMKDKLILEDGKIRLEASERDLIGKNNILSSELKVYKEEVLSLRTENSGINQTTFSQEKVLTELRIKNELMASQIEEKDKNIHNLTALVDNLNKQKTENEENLKYLKNGNNKLEDKIQASINEINKGNDIIQKLQSDLKTQKSKVKILQQSMIEKDQLVIQKQNLIDEHSRGINELKREIEKREEEIIMGYKTVDGLKSNLEECRRVIEDNEKMIRFLNKNLNESFNPFRNFLDQNAMTMNHNKKDIQQLTTETNQNQPQLQTELTYKNENFVSGSSFGKQPYFNSDAFQSLNFGNPGSNNNVHPTGGFIMPETNFTNFKSSGGNNNYQVQDSYNVNTGIGTGGYKSSTMNSSNTNFETTSK